MHAIYVIEITNLFSYKEVVMSPFVMIVVIALVVLFAMLSLLPEVYKDSGDDSLVQLQD